jgi:hypothetical protein
MDQDATAKHVPLLVAAFSRNWGGWLASEAFEYLLGRPEIDDPLRQLFCNIAEARDLKEHWVRCLSSTFATATPAAVNNFAGSRQLSGRCSPI